MEPEYAQAAQNNYAARGMNTGLGIPTPPQQPLTPRLEEIEGRLGVLIDRLQTIEGRLFGYKPEAVPTVTDQVPPQGVTLSLDRLDRKTSVALQLASHIADRI